MLQTKAAAKLKTHILYSTTFIFENNVENFHRAGQATQDNIIWHMRNASWKIKATNTRSEYVIFTSFPPRQWLHERASTLRYTYTACLVLLMNLVAV